MILSLDIPSCLELFNELYDAQFSVEYCCLSENLYLCSAVGAYGRMRGIQTGHRRFAQVRQMCMGGSRIQLAVNVRLLL